MPYEVNVYGWKLKILLNVDDLAQYLVLCCFTFAHLKARGWYDLLGFSIVSPFTSTSIISIALNSMGFGEIVPNRSQINICKKTLSR